MALDFSLITQAPSVGERFYQGQRDVQQEAEQKSVSALLPRPTVAGRRLPISRLSLPRVATSSTARR